MTWHVICQQNDVVLFVNITWFLALGFYQVNLGNLITKYFIKFITTSSLYN
jgi:hypothetical protein